LRLFFDGLRGAFQNDGLDIVPEVRKREPELLRRLRAALLRARPSARPSASASANRRRSPQRGRRARHHAVIVGIDRQRGSTSRMRRHRQRRREETRRVKVDANDSGIAALVGRGFLPEEARVDPLAIKAAVEVEISDLAFEVEQERSKGSGPRL
jgi:hypothetical protein